MPSAIRPRIRARANYTIRLKLPKISALVRVTVRRVWFALAESCPYQTVFAQVFDNLCRWQLPPPLPAPV